MVYISSWCPIVILPFLHGRKVFLPSFSPWQEINTFLPGSHTSPYWLCFLQSAVFITSFLHATIVILAVCCVSFKPHFCFVPFTEIVHILGCHLLSIYSYDLQDTELPTGNCSYYPLPSVDLLMPMNDTVLFIFRYINGDAINDIHQLLWHNIKWSLYVVRLHSHTNISTFDAIIPDIWSCTCLILTL